MKLNIKRYQTGFTLIEMMIGITIGLVAMSSILLVFSVSINSNNDGLKRLKLGQELRTILDVMVRDIRRSGYWQSATGTVMNPYSTLFVSGDATCITYSYDLNGNAVPQNSEKFGFRLSGGGVKYRSAGVSCNAATGWVLISDTSTINITTLSFGEVIICENLSDDDDDDTCSTAAPNDILSRRLNIDVVLAGQLVNDPAVTYTLADSVTVRNAVPSLNGIF